RRRGHAAGEGNRGRGASERTQLRGGARRPVLHAGLAEGAVVPPRGGTAARIRPGARGGLRRRREGAHRPGGRRAREPRGTRARRYDEGGKVLLARDAVEQARLEAIAERARANGVPGVQMVGPAGLAEVEPEARGVAALISPSTAVTDYRAVTAALAADVRAAGGQVRTGCRVERVVPLQCGVRVVTEPATESAIEPATGPVLYDRVIVCAGLQSDRVARRGGGGADP